MMYRSCTDQAQSVLRIFGEGRNTRHPALCSVVPLHAHVSDRIAPVTVAIGAADGTH